MQSTLSTSVVARACETRAIRARTFRERWFPVPRLLLAGGCGVDISDSSAKILSFTRGARGLEIDAFAQGPLPEGVVVNGVVRDPVALGAALAALSAESHAPKGAHVALPEEAAYVFAMHVPDVRDERQVRTVIEFEFEGRVPLRSQQAVYDYDVIDMHADGVGAEVSVSVFPKDIVEGYEAAIRAAGMRPLSFELEASSIARAVVPYAQKKAALLVDFGRARTGIAILKGNVPIFTSTVAVGGDTITAIIMEQMKVGEAEAERYKNEHGIAPGDNQKVGEIITGTAAALADEIVRHYQYWDTRRNERGERVTPIESVLLTGGSSNLKGLPEYIAGRVKAATTRVDVWQNVCTFDEYVPTIDENHALGLSTVIGLALRAA